MRSEKNTTKKQKIIQDDVQYFMNILVLDDTNNNVCDNI